MRRRRSAYLARLLRTHIIESKSDLQIIAERAEIPYRELLRFVYGKGRLDFESVLQLAQLTCFKMTRTQLFNLWYNEV